MTIGSGSVPEPPTTEMEFVQVTSSPEWPPCHPNNPNQPADCGWDPSIPEKSICLENYENAKKKVVKSKEPNYLMDLMDFCIKAQVNERETCTMKEFQGIYKEGVTELEKNGQGRGDRKIVTPRISTSWA